MALKLSENGANLIKSWESCSLTAYKGSGETYYTIGWGHYGADVYEGMTITQEQADQLFLEDIVPFEDGVNQIAVSKFPTINQNQFDALVSYAYNRGLGASDGSNGLRQLIYNSNSLEEVSNNFLVYWGTNTDVYEGLMNRRKKEKELFDTPCEDTITNAEIIEKAIQFCVDIANDDTHGYDQTNRDSPDYDCSSLMYYAWDYAGLDVFRQSNYWTGTMSEDFQAVGFQKITYSYDNLVRGDVLWRTGHTELYMGDNQRVGASINELGTTTGGQTGDQTGQEIRIKECSSNDYWEYVFRLPSDGSTPIIPDTPDNPSTPNNSLLSKLLLYAIASDDF